MSAPLSGRHDRVAVVGAGALGCAILPRLARMRMSALLVIDGDSVEQRNLDRQPLYAEADIGQPKASTARGWIQMIVPDIEVRAVDRFLNVDNARELFAGADIVADCTDDLHAKTLIDEMCGELGIPLVSGAVHEQQGQVIVLHASGAYTELRRSDLFHGRVGQEQDGCNMQRVPKAVIEAVGERMAAHVNALLNDRSVENGRIELLDRDNWTIMEIAR